MELLRVFPFVTASLLTFAACQSSEALPPPLGNCVADSGCSPVTGVSGGGGGTGTDGGGGDAAATKCAADPAASQCDQCAANKCCASLSACTSSTDCRQLLSCILNCPSTGCVAACKQQFPAGTQPYQTLESCLQVDCPICAESGVGDPCSAPCVAGLACQGSWCTAACAKDSDCQGIGPNGGNTLGQPNVCIPTSSGPRCAPGCSVNTDCAYFPGTYCHSTLSVENTNVQVCAALPDASSD